MHYPIGNIGSKSRNLSTPDGAHRSDICWSKKQCFDCQLVFKYQKMETV